MQTQFVSDRVAIGLSFMCIVHCLLLPVLLVLAPSAFLAFVSDESVHKVLLLAIVPVGIYAIIAGFKTHKKISVIVLISIGLLLLISTGLLEHEVLGESGEVLLTLSGSLLIAMGHIQNVRLRKKVATQA